MLFNDDQIEQTSRAMKAMSHPLRLKIISVLAEGEVSVQDIVEQVLVESNHLRTFRAYVAYRDQHQRLRETRRTLVDVEAAINEYVSRSDWRVNANANQGYSLGGLILNVSGKVIAN